MHFAFDDLRGRTVALDAMTFDLVQELAIRERDEVFVLAELAIKRDQVALRDLTRNVFKRPPPTHKGPR